MNTCLQGQVGLERRKRSPHRDAMLALVTDAFGGYGGIAQYNRDFLAASAESTLFSKVLVLPRIAPLTTGSLPARLNQASPLKNRLAYSARALFRAWRTKPVVIFNAHILHGPLALVLARLTGAKLISQLHGTEIWMDIAPRHRAALERSDMVLAVSRDTRARALSQLRIAPEKVVVLNNTVADAFTPGDRKEARQRYGLGGGQVMLTVARLDARNGYKGHDRIIRLLPEIRKRGIDVTYLIAGTGPDKDRLAALACDLGVGELVRFLGMVPDEELPYLYRAADLFALPSTGEGFGIAYLEAMACNTPAIGLAVGGAPDALGDGTLGSCVDPDEFREAMIEALDRSANRPEQLSELVQERFGRDKFASALNRLFGSLLQIEHEATPARSP